MNFRTLNAAVALTLFAVTVPAFAKIEFNQEFAKFDRNADGVITREEFPADPALFGRVDLNRDGGISCAEAKKAVRNRRLMKEEMKRLDLNRDGRISRNEWRGDLAAFDRYDKNADGVWTKLDRR